MNRRIPTWIAMALSGVLVAAAPLAHAGGDKDKSHSSAMQKSGDEQAHGMKDRRSEARRDRQEREDGRLSGAGTEAAGSSQWRAEMSRCTSMTDRRERAECAREVWEERQPRI
jgi:hypothetical protein